MLSEWQKENPYFIRKLSVKGLFKYKDIEWNLGPVNVLVGKNGSGKSTLLKLINIALNNNHNDASEHMPWLMKKIERVTATLNNELSSTFGSVSDDNLGVVDPIVNNYISSSKKEKKSARQLQIDIEHLRRTLLETFPSDDKNIKLVFSGSSDFITGNEDIPVNTLLKNINVEYISTFDTLLLSKDVFDKYSNKKYSQLDIEIEMQVSQLTGLMLSLSNATSTEYAKRNSKKDFSTIKSNYFSRVNTFIKEVNRLFNPEGKTFSIEPNGKLKVSCFGSEIDIKDLSSGEKQMLFILLKTINSSDKPTIIMLDEPEISLHLNWQENLIETLRKINPKTQIILVSHSPAVVMKGWMNSLVDMKDISFKSK